MKVISLWQVWASAMFTYEAEAGVDRPIKTIETRHWPICVPVGGFELAIHAAKHPYRQKDYPRSFTTLVTSLGLDGPFIPYGAILGTVWVESCQKVDDLINKIGELEKTFGNYINEDDDGNFQQRYGYVTDPFRIKILKHPFPLKGAQGLFSWNPPAGLEWK